MDRGKKRLLAALLVAGPAIVITIVFLLAPKSETPRDEALPEGNLTAVAFGEVRDGDEGRAASGNVTLYTNGTGHFLYFQGYDARSGPNVWFHLVSSNGTEDIEDDGVRLRVPGPGQATYRGTFIVPVPDDVEVSQYDTVVAWDRTINARFSLAALAPL